MTADDILAALEARADRLCSCVELPALYGKRRIDFWTLDPVGNNEIVAYEIKVTRADFKSDTEEKQGFARTYSNRLFYVTPPGLVAKEEVPEWAGLQEWDGKTFVTRKRAPRTDARAPNWQLVGAIIRNSTRVRRDIAIMTEELNIRRRIMAKQERDAKQASEHMLKTQKKLLELGINPYSLSPLTEEEKRFV